MKPLSREDIAAAEERYEIRGDPDQKPGKRGRGYKDRYVLLYVLWDRKQNKAITPAMKYQKVKLRLLQLLRGEASEK